MKLQGQGQPGVTGSLGQGGELKCPWEKMGRIHSKSVLSSLLFTCILSLVKSEILLISRKHTV